MAGEDEEEDVPEVPLIPWYLIDPTGDAIRAQRKAWAAKEEQSRLNNMTPEQKRALQAQRLENQRIDYIAGHGGQGEHKGGGRSHADGGFQFVGDTHKRAQPEELYQYVVVDQD